jgi:hypothetical protein
MAPASNIPEYTGWLGGIFGAIVGIVVLFKRFRGFITGAVKFFAAVAQVADLDARLAKVERDQVNKGDIDTLRTDLQNTMSANFTNVLNEVRFLFTSFENRMNNDIYRKYESLDHLTQRLSAKDAEIAAWEEKKNAETNRPVKQ